MGATANYALLGRRLARYPRPLSDERAHADAWYHAYWRHGRESLGFGVHVLERPRRTVTVVA